MTRMQKLLTILAAAVLMVPAIGALDSSEAQALDLRIGAQLDLSYESTTTGEGDSEQTDSDTTFGAKVPVFFNLHPMFGIGPVLGFQYTGGSQEDANGNSADKTSITAFKIGAGIRSEFHQYIAGQVLFTYDIGSATTPAGDTDIESDIGGIDLQAQVLVRGKLDPFKIWVEFGPYFGYRSYTVSTDAGGTTVETDMSGLSIGLVGQFTFGVGM